MTTFQKIFLFFSVAFILRSFCNAQTITNITAPGIQNGDSHPQKMQNISSTAAAEQQTNVTVESILSMLDDGEKEIVYRPGEDVILLIGRTGTGKSAVTQFLAENDRLQAAKDGGEFVISDDEGKISSESTTRSHTFIPDWVPNNRTNTSFYDCPGFEDTRGVDFDIANSFFIQSVLSKSGRVKFILVEDHHNLKKNGERDLFLKLLRFVAALIKDVGKFNASIALCANKVQSSESDEEVISYIAEFINNTRDGLAEGSNEMKLIDILLNVPNQTAKINYTRIGLLRTPTETGFIKDMPSFQKNKRTLDNIIYEYLRFTKMEEDDFRYTISDNSKLHINELVDEVATRITSNIANLTNSIAVHFQLLETGLLEDSIANLAAQYMSAYLYLFDVKQQLEKSENLQVFVERTIPEMSINLNVTFEPNVVSNITKNKDYLEFLQKVGDNSTMPSWSRGFATNELKFLDSSQRWYTFYSKFYNELCSYNIQKDHQKYNTSEFTATLDRLLANPKQAEFSIQQTGLKTFVTQFPTLELDYNLEPNMTINRFKVENMQKMVKISFEYKVEVLPSAHNVLIQGRFVTFSNVMKHLTNVEFTTIAIFASKTIFIDASLNRTGTLDQLTIVAPKWSVITGAKSTISIILNGVNGQKFAEGKAHDGQSVEKPDGEDGKPGITGSTAGNFLGLGDMFVSDEKLFIFARGGNGSSGQNGGNGLDGRNGESPINTKYGNDINGLKLCDDDADFGGDFNSEKISRAQCEAAFAESKLRPTTCCGRIVHAKYSTNGGNAGHGGAAGFGGMGGTVKVMIPQSGNFSMHLNLNDQNGIIASRGTPGTPGKAGKMPACDYDPIACAVVSFTVGPSPTVPQVKVFVRIKTSCQNESVPGKPGKYGGGIPSQPVNETKPLINPDIIVNHYKEFIRAELIEISGSLQETSPLKFLEHLETSPNVTDWYIINVLGLADDLQLLERQYFKYADKVNPSIFLPYYRFFQDRVQAVANNFRNSKDEDLKLYFSYMNAAAMTKITALNYQTSNNLIIDVTSYLDRLLERIKEYKNFKMYVEKANIQDQFQQQIQRAIEEAHNIVINSVNTEIDKIFDQLNNDTAQLIIDVEKAEKEAQEQVKLLKEYREKLKHSIIIINILSIVETSSMFLTFLGPVGAGAGAVIAGGAEIGKSVASVGDLQNAGNVPSSTTIEDMTDRLKREGQVFKDQLTEGLTLLDKTRTSDGEVAELKEEFQAAKKTIEEEEKKNKFSSVPPEKVQSERQELRQKLEKRGNTTKHADIVDLCDQLQVIIGITGEFYNYYQQNKANKGRLAELDRAIQEAERAAYQLNQFKQAIYTDMIPMFENIHASVDNLGERLQNDSHASLAVAKWKVQRTLDNVIRMLDDISQVFDIARDMTTCMIQVQQGALLTIDIYDTIQDYEDRSQMVSYIHDISKNDLGQITNASIRLALDRTTAVVEANIIVGEYFNAMSTIKPYVFPFPTYFLGSVYSLPMPSGSPSDLGSAEMEEMVNRISRNISSINDLIKKDQLEVKGEYDQYIRQAKFTVSKSTSPFYSWKGDPDLVRRLLRGEVITVPANVRDQNKNAVKFKEIGIHLRIQSATENITAEEVEAQKDLDAKLEAYFVYMTHMGVSYYRCEDTFYVIHTNDNLTFSYSIEMNEKGEPMDKNNVYDKVSQGVYVLSPYTTWHIRLKPAQNYAAKNAALRHTAMGVPKSASAAFLNKSVEFDGTGPLVQHVDGAQLRAFSEFEQFLNRSIILELEGKGQYVDPEGGPKICLRERVSDYYEKVRSRVV